MALLCCDYDIADMELRLFKDLSMLKDIKKVDVVEIDVHFISNTIIKIIYADKEISVGLDDGEKYYIFDDKYEVDDYVYLYSDGNEKCSGLIPKFIIEDKKAIMKELKEVGLEERDYFRVSMEEIKSKEDIIKEAKKIVEERLNKKEDDSDKQYKEEYEKENKYTHYYNKRIEGNKIKHSTSNYLLDDNVNKLIPYDDFDKVYNFDDYLIKKKINFTHKGMKVEFKEGKKGIINGVEFDDVAPVISNGDARIGFLKAYKEHGLALAKLLKVSKVKVNGINIKLPILLECKDDKINLHFIDKEALTDFNKLNDLLCSPKEATVDININTFYRLCDLVSLTKQDGLDYLKKCKLVEELGKGGD